MSCPSLNAAPRACWPASCMHSIAASCTGSRAARQAGCASAAVVGCSRLSRRQILIYRLGLTDSGVSLCRPWLCEVDGSIEWCVSQRLQCAATSRAAADSQFAQARLVRQPSGNDATRHRSSIHQHGGKSCSPAAVCCHWCAAAAPRRVRVFPNLPCTLLEHMQAQLAVS